MKKKFFCIVVLFIVGLSAVYAQNNQTLNAGQVFTANMTAGAVHTYRIQLGTDAAYFIELQDNDNADGDGYADLRISVRHSEDAWFRDRINEQDINRVRLYNIKNPNLASGGDTSIAFFPNSYYIIEVRGYDDSSRGSYKIAFY